MNNFAKTKYFLMLIMIFLILPVISFAQLNDRDVTLEILPSSPGPFSEVNAKVVSYSVDLNKMLITWRLNDKLQISGIGEKNFSFRTDAVGKISKISATISAGEISILKEMTIAPGEVDLLWEAIDSYVPPLYRGKALPAMEGKIKVVAIPNIKSGNVFLKPENFVYKWELNNSPYSNYSGYGKNYLVFKTNYFNNAEKVSVKAESAKGNQVARNLLTLVAGEPKIVFYEKGLFGGTNYQKAIDRDFSLFSGQTTIAAEPYFFSVQDKNDPDLEYSWLINGAKAPPTGEKSELGLRGGGEHGTARINLNIKSKSKILQKAKKDFVVSF